MLKKSPLAMLLLSAAIGLCSLLRPAAAHADVKYDTYTKDSRSDVIWLQPAYLPVGVLGQHITVPDPANPGAQTSSPMQNPKDIFIDGNDQIYIADTGNNRIIQMTDTGELVRFITLPDSPFNKPEGVFVTKNGDIYVADSGNKRVVRLDKTGRLLQEYKRPQSSYITSSFVFDPAKVMVDARGFLYIAVHGSYEGLVMEDPNGKFLGFFGANQTVLSPLEAIKRMLYPKQMYENEMPKFPETINSIATDKNGYIYTVSGGTISTGQLKKLNIKGKDLIGSISYGETVPWAAPSASTYSAAGPAVSGPQLADVAVDSNGNMIVVDQNYKFISNYDSSGGLLYFWGGGSTIGSDQVGLLKSPVALDVNSRDELFVLDDQENVVQVFRMSEFAQKVNEANRETLAGNYESSEKLWRDVLRLNAQFNPAIMGLANAAFYTGKYTTAKELYKQAGDAQGYSDSFWQIRMKWFEHYFSTIASVLVILLVLYLAFSKLTERSEFRQRFRDRKRSDNRLLAKLRFIFYFLRHPIDAFSDIHYENKGGYLSAIVILLLVYASLLIQQMATSFSFRASSYVDIYSTFTQFFTVWIAWVLCNYLVSSIYQGEGKFRDIFIGSSYVFLPFVVVGIPMALLSNVMTLSEGSIYNYVSRGMIVWVAALIFWQIQNVHNYTVGKTFMNIFLSVCTMLALGVSIFVTFGLTSDLFSLFHQMFQELSLR